jgi:hypothetical protein
MITWNLQDGMGFRIFRQVLKIIITLISTQPGHLDYSILIFEEYEYTVLGKRKL